MGNRRHGVRTTPPDRKQRCEEWLSFRYNFSRLVPTDVLNLPPCPGCATTTAKAVRFPGELVAWCICGTCGHAWCLPVDDVPDTSLFIERRVVADRRDPTRPDRRNQATAGRRSTDVPRSDE